MTVLSAELFKQIRRIQIVSTHLAKDIFAGVYRSAFKGKGMEFEEVREYQAGDEIRNIDWNVTARMGRPYVKNYREEWDLSVILVVDVSASTRFGGQYGLKSTLITKIGAVLAFSAIKNNDKVGLLLFSDHVEKYIPPGKGTRHVLHIIRELLVFEPQHQGSDLKNALHFLGNLQIRAGICFLISDFFFPECQRQMALTAAKHDLIAVAVTDSTEYTMPNLGLAEFQDLETGEKRIVDASKIASTQSQRLDNLRKMMNKIGADLIDIRTDKSYVNVLRKFFKIRGERRR